MLKQAFDFFKYSVSIEYNHNTTLYQEFILQSTTNLEDSKLNPFLANHRLRKLFIL